MNPSETLIAAGIVFNHALVALYEGTGTAAAVITAAYAAAGAARKQAAITPEYADFYEKQAAIYDATAAACAGPRIAYIKADQGVWLGGDGGAKLPDLLVKWVQVEGGIGQEYRDGGYCYIWPHIAVAPADELRGWVGSIFYFEGEA